MHGIVLFIISPRGPWSARTCFFVCNFCQLHFKKPRHVTISVICPLHFSSTCFSNLEEESNHERDEKPSIHTKIYEKPSFPALTTKMSNLLVHDVGLTTDNALPL